MAKETNEKLKVLQSAVSSIEKKYGKGSVMRLGEKTHLEVPAISTGALTLDIAAGIGGIPKGRVVEIYGPESSGKTTLTLHIVAEAQKQGGIAAFIDAEHALDPAYAKKVGVDVDNLYISQPDDGEQALEIAEQLVRSGAIEILIVDSVAALVPRAEISGNMGDSHMGLQARLMSQALRKLTGVINKSSCSVIFINQIRHKIGVFYGSPETTTGGNALKFYASMRMDIRKKQVIKNSGGEPIGSHVLVKIVKNKMAPPFKKAEFDIFYDKGISQLGCIIDLAVENKIISKAGSWYSYGEERLGQGVDNVKSFLTDNPDIMEKIRKQIHEIYGLRYIKENNNSKKETEPEEKDK